MSKMLTSHHFPIQIRLDLVTYFSQFYSFLFCQYIPSYYVLKMRGKSENCRLDYARAQRVPNYQGIWPGGLAGGSCLSERKWQILLLDNDETSLFVSSHRHRLLQLRMAHLLSKQHAGLVESQLSYLCSLDRISVFIS